MILCPKLVPAPECCDEVTCDFTRHRPVLGGSLGVVWEVHTRLLHWKLGEPLPRYSLPNSLEEVQQGLIPERVLHWAERVPNV